MRVKVWFLRQGGFKAALARLFLLSPWNAVAIECRNAFYVTDEDAGVCILDRLEFEWMHPQRTFSIVTVQDPSSLTHFLGRQMAKPFDWGCYLPMFRRGTWTLVDRWFSSELVACALNEAGCKIKVPKSRCTPSQLWRGLPKVVAYHQT